MRYKLINHLGVIAIALLLFLTIYAGDKMGEVINWQVLGGGGNASTSNGTFLFSTVGQTATGSSTSNGTSLSHGFWQDFETPDICSFVIPDVNGPLGGSVGVPIKACDAADVVGLEFHVENDSNVVRSDSITTAVFSDALIGITSDEISIIWEDTFNPVSFSEGDTIITLWYTCTGNEDDVSQLTWIGNNELVDSDGEPITGFGFENGSITISIEVHNIAGHVYYYNMAKIIEATDISITPSVLPDQSTSASGAYMFADLSAGTYILDASRINDDAGVSVADIIKIRLHLAHLEEFDMPYKLIAADINGSASVSVADVVKLRRYLAQIEPLESGNWMFIDSAYAITNSNWSTAPQTIAVSLSDHDINNCSFVGVRMGDVNDTWSPVKAAKPSSSIAKSVLLKDTYGVTGDDISIPLLVEANTEIAGIELHLKYDSENLEYIKTESELLGELTVYVNNGAIHVVWEDIDNTFSTKSDVPIVQFHFNIKDDFESESEIEITNAEIVDIKGEAYNLNLINGKVIKGSPSIVLPEEYSLEQNIPNPFNPITEIRFSLPEASDVCLEIFNIMGQRVQTLVNEPLEAGYHSYTWNAGSYASGVYFTRLRAGTFVDTKKMILLK